jgi:hypothetical protein
MISPNWEDVNKLEEQNKQMRIWIEQQTNYIEALKRAIPTALMEDWEPTLPTLPNIPKSLALCTPERMLKNPVDASQGFSVSFPDKIALPPVPPPRESSKEADFVPLSIITNQTDAGLRQSMHDFSYLAGVSDQGTLVRTPISITEPTEFDDFSRKYFVNANHFIKADQSMSAKRLGYQR